MNPEILVVEGWLSEDALQKACDEFAENDYKLILTTGFLNGESFIIGSFARLIFNLHDAVPFKDDSLYCIIIKIKGTEAGGEFAHFKVFADSIEVGNNFTTRKFKQYKYKVKITSPPDQIIVEFDNDFLDKSNDRNLIIDEISVNDFVFPVNTESVELYQKKHGTFSFMKKLSHSSAHNAANYLVSAGIPDSLIVPIVTSDIRKSKTFSTALDVREWLTNSGHYSRASINIFSQGIHSRRTWLSYHKVFQSQSQVGVITCPDPGVLPESWWKSAKGWKEILYETIGVIYVFVFL